MDGHWCSASCKHQFNQSFDLSQVEIYPLVHVYIQRYPYLIHVMMRHFHNPGFSHQLSQSYYVTKLSHGSGIFLSRRWLYSIVTVGD